MRSSGSLGLAVAEPEETEPPLKLPKRQPPQQFRRSWIVKGRVLTGTLSRKNAGERWHAVVDGTGHMGSGDTLEELMDSLGGV